MTELQSSMLNDVLQTMDRRLEEAHAALEASFAEEEAARELRRAVQSRCAALERAYQQLAASASRRAADLDRLARFADRVAAVEALPPPPTTCEVPARAAKALRDVPLLRHELVATAVEIQVLPAISGIYFLLEGQDVVYVGQSINLVSRVATHASEGRKSFSAWCYVAAPRRDLDELERFYIRLLRPALNIHNKPALTDELEGAVS